MDGAERRVAMGRQKGEWHVAVTQLAGASWMVEVLKGNGETWGRTGGIQEPRRSGRRRAPALRRREVVPRPHAARREEVGCRNARHSG